MNELCIEKKPLNAGLEDWLLNHLPDAVFFGLFLYILARVGRDQGDIWLVNIVQLH